jgi:hypothetical protein
MLYVGQCSGVHPGTHIHHLPDVFVDNAGVWLGGEPRCPVEGGEALVGSGRRV